jgi:homopolymeric O-antigen transport system ATP-binding protein
MRQAVIRAVGLGKKYRPRLQDRARLIARFRYRDDGEPFWALRHCSFELAPGELVGIVGVNGAGKSTLLKILSRVTRPNEGRAEIYGRVGSLLEVGTGFHPDLTGRENVFLNGALIGMRKDEIRRKFDDIVDFAGIDGSIDTPIKRYSSGMKVRLAFAVAAHLEQEIMLVDEVLAVGDSAFRLKCFNKINEVTRQGRAVLLVSHELTSIARKCDRAIWLDAGCIRADGSAPEVVERYMASVVGAEGSHHGVMPIQASSETATSALELTHIRLLDEGNNGVPCFATGQPAKFAFGYSAAEAAVLPTITLSVTILNLRRQPVAVCESVAWASSQSGPLPPRGELVCEVAKLPLVPGRYSLDIVCRLEQKVVRRITGAGDFHVVVPLGVGALPAPGTGDVLLDHRWSTITDPDNTQAQEPSPATQPKE